MWEMVKVQVPNGAGVVRGRYRMEGDQLVLEWRGGRTAERCGLVKPEVVAMSRLKQLVGEQGRVAA
ncbi:MAG TPA: hypothetical protein VGC92_16000 [Phenylobacterium sp.]|jgi:hypothetical protein